MLPSRMTGSTESGTSFFLELETFVAAGAAALLAFSSRSTLSLTLALHLCSLEFSEVSSGFQAETVGGVTTFTFATILVFLAGLAAFLLFLVQAMAEPTATSLGIFLALETSFHSGNSFGLFCAQQRKLSAGNRLLS